MGLLTEGEPPPRTNGGPGQKFVDLYWASDDEDREKIRRWSQQKPGGIMHIYLKLLEAKYKIGYTTVERGLERLEATRWES